MKRLVAILFFLLPSLFLKSQESCDSEALLLDISNRLERMGAAKVEFLFDKIQGTLHLQGDMFRLKTDIYEVMCDGESKWSYSSDDEEVVVVPQDTSSTDLMENPLAFFMHTDNKYKCPKRAESVERDSKRLWKIELKPVVKGASYTQITLYIDQATKLPSLVKCILKDNTSYSIDILSISPTQAKPQSWFVFDSSAYGDVYVVDLR